MLKQNKILLKGNKTDEHRGQNC